MGLFHMYAATYKEMRTAFNWAAWNHDMSMFRMQSKTNAEKKNHWRWVLC
jgi:hypothetical protein